MDQLMQVIMLWLSVTFGLPSVANPPTVQQLPGSTIASLRYGAAIEDRHDVLALYDRRTRTVILRQDWHSQSPADVSVLVHELVHHLQEQAGLDYECAAAREALAFAAQQRWLELFGLNLEIAFGIDPMTLKLRTSCISP